MLTTSTLNCMGDHELNIYIYTQLHHNTPLSCTVQCILFCNVCILGCETAFPPLPNHGICIYYVEYTHPQTGKTFWLGKGGNVLSKTFPVSYVFDSNNKLVRTENQTYFISLRGNERQFTKFRFIAKFRFIGNTKNL